MSQKVGFDCSRLETYKIFRKMTTADSVSVTRLGDTRRLDDFWTILSVYFPEENDIAIVRDTLETLTEFLRYADMDIVGTLLSEPNDPLYLPDQTGLHDEVHGINAEEAWAIQEGQEYTRVGVYDSGINWRHEDFGDGTWEGSKIAGGYDYHNFAFPFNQATPDPIGHGTAVAGIIGALRDNQLGMAGVAGGGDGSTGCQLYSMGFAMGSNVNPNIQSAAHTFHSVVAPAIVEGAAFNPNTGFGYGLHIQNHSWGSKFSSTTLKAAVRSCFLDDCFFVASSGNTTNTNPNIDQNIYPATYDNRWVLKVGANDATGERAVFSLTGAFVDLIAPGTPDIYVGLSATDNSEYDYIIPGTSFAAPHAAGVAALLHSEHNIENPAKNYPNDLAPEDLEFILNTTARDIPPAGFQPETGNGLLQAGDALQFCSLPDRFVQHYGGSNNTGVLLEVSDILVGVSPENIFGLISGVYTADRVRVTNSWTIPIDPGLNPVDSWVRFGSSVGMDDLTTLVGEPFFDATFSFSNDHISVTTTTYTYLLKSRGLPAADGLPSYVVPLNPPIWFPAPPTELKTNFSVLFETNQLLTSENIDDVAISVYPNPCIDQLTISSNNLTAIIKSVEIFDSRGVQVSHHLLSGFEQLNWSATLDVSKLSAGVYIVKLNNSEIPLVTKFSKL